MTISDATYRRCCWSGRRGIDRPPPPHLPQQTFFDPPHGRTILAPISATTASVARRREIADRQLAAPRELRPAVRYFRQT